MGPKALNLTMAIPITKVVNILINCSFTMVDYGNTVFGWRTARFQDVRPIAKQIPGRRKEAALQS